MPRIKRIGMTDEYNALVGKTFEHGETNDCAIKAICLVTGADYRTVREMLAERGRRARKGTYTADSLAVIRDLGFEPWQLSYLEMREIVSRYPGCHKNLRHITTHHPRRFAQVWPKGRFLIQVRGHICAVIEGQLHDWSANKALRVISMWRVIRKG
jgi:hypothetical protein